MYPLDHQPYAYENWLSARYGQLTSFLYDLEVWVLIPDPF